MMTPAQRCRWFSWARAQRWACWRCFLLYLSWQKQLSEENTRIKQLQAQKADLEQVKQQVDTFEAQKKILTQRVATIEQLQRDRTGAQELLDEIASTVSRTENLWLITMTRKGTIFRWRELRRR